MELTVGKKEFPKETLQDIDTSTSSMVLVRGQALDEEDQGFIEDAVKFFNGKVIQYALEDNDFQRKSGVARFEGTLTKKNVAGALVLDFVLGLHYV